jgi:uncharacterized repeat protein (TIGR03833 family)
MFYLSIFIKQTKVVSIKFHFFHQSHRKIANFVPVLPKIMDSKKPDGRSRQNIEIGQLVEIVQKQDQQSGDLTEGIIKRILTNASFHPHGIKVRLNTGEVGRVKNIIPEED